MLDGTDRSASSRSSATRYSGASDMSDHHFHTSSTSPSSRNSIYPSPPIRRENRENKPYTSSSSSTPYMWSPAAYHPSQNSFYSVPGISPDVVELARSARVTPSPTSTSSRSASAASSSSLASRSSSGSTAQGHGTAATSNVRKGKNREPEGFYPMSYIRGEWLDKLLASGLSKRKIRYYLSDETLCLGTPDAPITSEFSRPLIFHEAYLLTDAGGEKEAKIYMTEYQVGWLVDELYALVGEGTDKRMRIEFEAIDVDKTRMVKRSQFQAIRKISFAKDVARFRSKCGLRAGSVVLPPASSPMSMSAKSISSCNNSISPNQTSGVETRCAETVRHMPLKASTSAGGAKKQEPRRATPLPPLPSPPSIKPLPFQALPKHERQARKAQHHAEQLAAWTKYQGELLPFYRLLYENLVRYGGAALSCDVESWTEDADVLLELGMAWIEWKPDGEAIHGNSHFVIEETMQYRNEEIQATRWDYKLGKSETLPQTQIAERLQKQIEQLSRSGPLILVFHDASAECRYFQRLGVDPSNYLTNLPRDLLLDPPLHWPGVNARSISQDGPSIEAGTDILIQDTQDIYCGWSEPAVRQINLGKACDALGIRTDILHNAGNDAAATLELWRTILESAGTQSTYEGSTALQTPFGQSVAEPEITSVNQIPPDDSSSPIAQLESRLVQQFEDTLLSSESSRQPAQQAVAALPHVEVDLIELW